MEGEHLVQVHEGMVGAAKALKKWLFYKVSSTVTKERGDRGTESRRPEGFHTNVIGMEMSGLAVVVAQP